MSKLFSFAALLIFTITEQTCSINFDIIPLTSWLQQNPEVQYQKCFDVYTFKFKPFPLSIDPSQQPYVGQIKETFILTIPNGRILSDTGCVLSNNHQIIADFIWKKRLHNIENIPTMDKIPTIITHHKVVVITQSAYTNYWHWISEILCRLALIDMFKIQYDYICIPQSTPFMKDSLALWGIDSQKIIPISYEQCFCIQANELIVPSLVSNTNTDCPLLSCYAQQHLLTYVKNKLLTAAQKTDQKPFAKNIFISRKDTPLRNILNEDDVFALLKPYGFERYELSNLSVTDQILLFHNANVIIAPQGTCVANTIFCDSKTAIIELFQGLCDSTFWYTSQMLEQNYTPFQTIPFMHDYITAWQSHTIMPLPIIQKLIDNLVSAKRISVEK